MSALSIPALHDALKHYETRAAAAATHPERIAVLNVARRIRQLQDALDAEAAARRRAAARVTP